MNEIAPDTGHIAYQNERIAAIIDLARQRDTTASPELAQILHGAVVELFTEHGRILGDTIEKSLNEALERSGPYKCDFGISMK